MTVCNWPIQNHVALWNGKKLEVYVISWDKPTLRDGGMYHVVHVASQYWEYILTIQMFTTLAQVTHK